MLERLLRLDLRLLQNMAANHVSESRKPICLSGVAAINSALVCLVAPGGGRIAPNAKQLTQMRGASDRAIASVILINAALVMV